MEKDMENGLITQGDDGVAEAERNEALEIAAEMLERYAEAFEELAK